MSRWLALAVLLAACSDAPASDPGLSADRGAAGQAPAPATGNRHAGHAEMTAGEITTGSIYNLAGEWWNDAGEEAPLTRLAGRPQVVALVYTSCAQACPAILAEMKRVEAALGDDAPRVGFVLASMDPERDTPAKLAEFARRARLDPARWTLLGAEADDVLELAAVLGVQYRQLPDGEFTHANILTVLDANGEIVHRQLGLGEGTGGTVAAARAHVTDANRT